MDLVVALTTFAVIFPAELPDKTFVATLVLSTRFRPVLVWVGVVAAFLVQTIVAVTAGGLLSLLPEQAVAAGTAVLFAAGSFVLFRSAAKARQEEEDAERELAERLADRPARGSATPATGSASPATDSVSAATSSAGSAAGAAGSPSPATGDASSAADAGPPARGGFAAVATSFGVLFLAEWGDLSQLLTAGLAARYGDPLSVFVGAWAALACVAGVGVIVGRALMRVVDPSTVRRLAGSLFAILAVLAALEAFGVDLPL